MPELLTLPEDELETWDEDEEDDDFAAVEDDEARRRPGRRLRVGRYGGARGIGGGVVHTPRGAVRFKLPKNVVTKDEFNKVVGQIREDAKKTAAAVSTVEKAVVRNTKAIKGAQQQALFMMLLNKPPPIASLETSSGQGTIAVTKTNYGATDMMLPMMLMMTSGGGLGGDSNSLMPLMLIMMLNKG